MFMHSFVHQYPLVYSCDRYGFAVSSISCDGAAENRTLADNLCDVAAQDMIPFEWLERAAQAAVTAAVVKQEGSETEQAMAEAEAAAAVAAALGAVKVGWTQKPGYEPRVIVFMCDMPHVVKKVVNSMERRGEDMMLDGKPVSLKILRDVWVATHFHDGHAALKRTKLSSAHFDKNQMTRMNVRLAVQVLSATMLNLCKVTLPRTNPDVHRRLSPLIGPTLQLVTHFNHAVDVMNSRCCDDKVKIDLVDQPDHRHVAELLHASAFLQRWKLQALRLGGIRTERPSRWLTKEAGADAIAMGLGVAALASLHARQDFVLLLRRLDQDCAENHFANVRRRGGNNGATTDTAKAAQQAANVNRFAKCGKSHTNTRGAEPDPIATSMVFDQREYMPSDADKMRESQHVFY